MVMFQKGSYPLEIHAEILTHEMIHLGFALWQCSREMVGRVIDKVGVAIS